MVVRGCDDGGDKRMRHPRVEGQRGRIAILQPTEMAAFSCLDDRPDAAQPGNN